MSDYIIESECRRGDADAAATVTMTVTPKRIAIMRKGNQREDLAPGEDAIVGRKEEGPPNAVVPSRCNHPRMERNGVKNGLL